MKVALTVLAAAAVAVVGFAPQEASAHRAGYRHKHIKTTYRTAAYYRPASIASNGLCQRDTGTPTSQLNFRNRCDTEEFWTRMQRGRRF